MSLRKASKANWHWDCRLCEYTSPRSPDRYGAELYGWDHEHGAQHFDKLMAEAVKPIVEMVTTVADAINDVFGGIAKNLSDAFDQMSYALAPPQNIPHDPGLRGDKRKWGGK